MSVGMKIDPGKALGAQIEGVDLAQPVSDEAFKQILRALGEHGVLCFPGQRLETAQFARFGRMFGDLEINVANQFHEPGFPEVMVLSNMTAEGKPVGLGDAGQGWHTDMSYSREIALANVLHAIKVPRRNGVPLGDTQFRNMHAAYEDLPADIKTRLKGRTATHDFAKFWDMTAGTGPSLAARAPHAGAARQEAAGVAADLSHPPDHRNDAGYGAEVHKLVAKGFDEKLAQWESPDFVALAKAFGGDGVKLAAPSDIGGAIAEGLRKGSLYLIDARVSPSTPTDPYAKVHFGIESHAPLLRRVA